MSKLLYLTNKIAGVGNAFQRDSLGSSHKAVFEESGHGIKYSPQSKHTGEKTPGLWSCGSFNAEIRCLFRAWTMSSCEQSCDISDFRSCSTIVFESEPLNNVSPLTQVF